MNINKNEEVARYLEKLQQLIKNPSDDTDQKDVVKLIQENRAMLLQVAAEAYVYRPADSKLLESVTKLVSEIEKSIRDDRKERSKKEEHADNQATYRQMVDALSNITNGNIAIPQFEMSEIPFLTTNVDLFKKDDVVDVIREGELTQGIQQLDIDGNVI